eukprot:Clim_evm11s109 gene=Clim_evmTU11s109
MTQYTAIIIALVAGSIRVAEGVGTCHGSREIITSQAELNAFAGCEVVNSDITIGGENCDLVDLGALSSLRGVEGHLTVHGCPSLQSINLPVLEEIDGYLRFDWLERVTTITLPRLRTVGESFHVAKMDTLHSLKASVLQSVGHDLTLHRNPLLMASQMDFGSLQTVGNTLTIVDNSELAHLSFFTESFEYTKKVVVVDNDNLQNGLGLSHLRSNNLNATTGLIFQRNEQLRVFPDFDDIEILGDDGLVIDGCDRIETLAGFPGLTKISGPMQIINNQSLRRIKEDALAQHLITAGSLEVENNPVLQDFFAPTSLQEIHGPLLYTSNVMTRVVRFPGGLHIVAGDVFVDHSDGVDTTVASLSQLEEIGGTVYLHGDFGVWCDEMRDSMQGYEAVVRMAHYPICQPNPAHDVKLDVNWDDHELMVHFVHSDTGLANTVAKVYVLYLLPDGDTIEISAPRQTSAHRSQVIDQLMSWPRKSKDHHLSLQIMAKSDMTTNTMEMAVGSAPGLYTSSSAKGTIFILTMAFTALIFVIGAAIAYKKLSKSDQPIFSIIAKASSDSACALRRSTSLEKMKKGAGSFRDLVAKASAPMYSMISVSDDSDSEIYDPLARVLIDESEVHMGAVITEGTFGKIHQGVYRSTKVAIKLAKPELVHSEAHTIDLYRFRNEAVILACLGHQHIVPMLGCTIDIDRPSIILQWMDGGDLASYLTKSPTISTGQVTALAAQAADAVAYIHRQGIVHRDLAARNFLVDNTYSHYQPWVYLSDFGMAISEDNKALEHQLLGAATRLPIRWLSLETLRFRAYSTQSDVWSFGVVLWEMYSLGARPYDGLTNDDVLEFLESQKRLSKPVLCPENMYSDVIAMCWLEDEDRRPSMDTIRQALEADGSSASSSDDEQFFDTVV